jgi:hypothetical protein
VTDRDATSTRDTSLKPSHAITSGRIQKLGAQMAGILATRAPSAEGPR